ncbi:MAG: DNA polymerase III subunit beta [Gammaproteobacteria bacterium]|nr:DNA polymerase III subunit beta [Gammaproteobacteria bacterium]
MKFSTDRGTLLKALSMVAGVVERPQQTQGILPVLSHLLFDCDDEGLSITGTDLEVELNVRISEGVEVEQPGRATVPGRKLAEIWRSLPEDAPVSVETGDQATVRSGRSRFQLATLPEEEYPSVDTGGEGETRLSVAPGDLRRLMDQTSFAMAQQDVRYYLNGLLFEVTESHIRTVATDGHRLAMCTLPGGAQGTERVQAIVPRKGVVELGRLLADAEDSVEISLGMNYLRAENSGYTLTTKLVEGKFPDYATVIPSVGERQLSGSRETLRQSFLRAAIIGSDQRRVAPLVRLKIEEDRLVVKANNAETQEEAEEEVSVDYQGDAFEIGFNVDYLQDVLGVVDTEDVRISISDGGGSALIETGDSEESVFVVMPMRL